MKHLPLLLSSGLSLLATGSAVAAEKLQKPNVIFLLSDDVGFGDLQCYNGKALTPNINNLASKGCLFTNAHAVASTSTPSRYSILTGQYAWREKGTGVAPGDAAMLIKPNRFTTADVFKNAGYTTGAFGKWHLGLGSTAGGQNWNGELDQSLTDIGFDEFEIMAATADRVPCVYIRGNSNHDGKTADHGHIVNLNPNDPIKVSYVAELGDSCGYNFPSACKLLPSDGKGHGNTIVDSIPRIGHSIGGRSALWKDGNIADSIAGNTIKFIKNCNSKGQPFFVYMCTNDIHVPRWPHARFQGKSGMGLRGDAILSLDWTLGQITHTLDSLGIADNTIIVLTSDNGPVLDDGYADNAVALANAKGHLISGGLRGGKYSSFEGGTRVPFIVSWPGHVTAATVSDAIVSQVDLLATMGDIIGQPVPLGAAPDSRVQTKAWLGQDLSISGGRDYVLEMTNDGSSVSVRNARWKYIPSSPESLYDMSACNTYNQYTTIKAATEATNVATANTAVLDSMRNILKGEIKKGDDIAVYGMAANYLTGITPAPTVVSKLDTLGAITTGLPGTLSGTQYVYTSHKFTSTKSISAVRLTFKATTTQTSGQKNAYGAYCPVALADFTLYDGDGNTVPLTVTNFSTNNQETTEGSMVNICDGSITNYWHSTWSVATANQPYLEITLPQAMNSFNFKYTTRKTANAPTNILVAASTSYLDTIASLNLPIGYQDTLRAEYARAEAHHSDPGFTTSLPVIVSTIDSYLTWKGYVDAGKLTVDDAKAATTLGVLTNDQFNSIKATLAVAGDIATDSVAYANIDAYFTPQEGACYTLYNAKQAKYAGMTNATASCHGTDPSSDFYNWTFVRDAQTGAYKLYNMGIQQAVNRTTSATSIYGQTANIDTWVLDFLGSSYFNVVINSSNLTTTRKYLNDNGTVINAYTDNTDQGTYWTIQKTSKLYNAVKPVNADNVKIDLSANAYDLFGRSTLPNRKGVVYIQGGKKFMLK